MTPRGRRWAVSARRRVYLAEEVVEPAEEDRVRTPLESNRTFFIKIRAKCPSLQTKRGRKKTTDDATGTTVGGIRAATGIPRRRSSRASRRRQDARTHRRDIYTFLGCWTHRLFQIVESSFVKRTRARARFRFQSFRRDAIVRRSRATILPRCDGHRAAPRLRTRFLTRVFEKSSSTCLVIMRAHDEATVEAGDRRRVRSGG